MSELNVIVRDARNAERLYPIDDQVSTGSRSNFRTVKVASGDLAVVDANNIIFAWENPEPNQIIVYEVIINVTTVATNAATMDVDRVNDAVSHGATILDAIDLNAAIATFDSHNVTDAGATGNEKPRLLNAQGSATNAWITGYESAAQPTDGIVGKYYIYYTEA